MMVSKLTRFVTLSLTLALLLAMIVVPASAQDGEEKVLVSGVNMTGGDPNTLDPSLSEASKDNQIIQMMYPGLTVQDELTAEVVPGIAESWEVSEDGTTYTYNLVQGIPWVHVNQETGEVEQVMDESGNPRMVTANDVVYAWQRTLNPETASPYAFLPAGSIVGGAEYLAGEADADALGIRAVDDYTLEIDVPEALAFTPMIHGLWMVQPLPQWAIEEGGDSWTEPEFVNSYGPFTMAEWAHDEGVVLVKNPFWPGTPTIAQPNIDRIELRFLDPETQWVEYQAGTMDAIDVPTEQLALVMADPDLSQQFSTGPQFCTYYLNYDYEDPTISNVHLRRALSLAIDRSAITENIYAGTRIPARWNSRPGLAGAPTPEEYPDLGIGFDPEEAQAELAIALEELGLASAEDLQLVAAYNESSNHGQVMEAVQQMWADNLGVNVQLTGMENTTYFTSVSEDPPQIFRSGWCSDYPDANNFTYDLYHSESAQNDPNYNNAEFDALTEQARTETDYQTRVDLYAQAEEILVDTDPATIPLNWYATRQLTQPYVERTYSILGKERYENWDIDMAARGA